MDGARIQIKQGHREWNLGDICCGSLGRNKINTRSGEHGENRVSCYGRVRVNYATTISLAIHAQAGQRPSQKDFPTELLAKHRKHSV